MLHVGGSDTYYPRQFFDFVNPVFNFAFHIDAFEIFVTNTSTQMFCPVACYCDTGILAKITLKMAILWCLAVCSGGGPPKTAIRHPASPSPFSRFYGFWNRKRKLWEIETNVIKIFFLCCDEVWVARVKAIKSPCSVV